MEATQRLVIDAQETLCCALLGDLVLKIPDAITMCEFFVLCATLKIINYLYIPLAKSVIRQNIYLRQDTTLKSGHVKQEIWIIF